MELKIRINPATQSPHCQSQPLILRAQNLNNTTLLQQQLRSDSLNNNNNSSNNNNNSNNNTLINNLHDNDTTVSPANNISNNDKISSNDNSSNNNNNNNSTSNNNNSNSSNNNNSKNNNSNIKNSPTQTTAQDLRHQFLMQITNNPMLTSPLQQQQRLDEYHPMSPTSTNTQNLMSTPSTTSSCNNEQNRPVQRRRIRRKATSSTDDQAEHLTEMSVRGLDLFRYACITEGVYQCTECAKENVQKTFKNKYSFQRHAFLYHEGKHRKVFPCPECGKEFSRPDKMKNHMKTTHENYASKHDKANNNNNNNNTNSTTTATTKGSQSTAINFQHHPLNYLITAAAAGGFSSSLQSNLDSNNSTVINTIDKSTIISSQSNLTISPATNLILEKIKNEIEIKNEFIETSETPIIEVTSILKDSSIKNTEEVK